MNDESVIAKGVIEKVGSMEAIFTYEAEDRPKQSAVIEVMQHDVAVEQILDMLRHQERGVIRSLDEIDSVGHRVVHGGEAFSGSVRVTDRVKEAIEKCIQFAPLHNPHNLKGILACERLLPDAPQVAVFDTAFHQTLPPNNLDPGSMSLTRQD